MLTSKQRSFLSRLAAGLKPTVMVGKDGVTGSVVGALKEEFSHRELVKLRFVASKEDREPLSRELAEGSGAELVRLIGNVAIYYRPSDIPELHRIELPF